ncbi:MAG TPA: AraC family transcriptional regulator [Xanthobacteraceae bacterium]|jgi:AraC-like DNA-binding protein
MAKQHIFSRRMQLVLGLSDERSAVLKSIRNNPLAATRCKLDGPLDVTTNRLPPEDVYMIVIQIQGKNSRELWLDGKPVKTEPLYAGGVVFHDLRQSPVFYFNDPLDSVNYFLPRKLLDTIADDAEVARISNLKFTPGIGVMDEVVKELTRQLMPAFDRPDQVSRLFAEHVSLALGTHIAQTYGGMKGVVAPRRGGLAAWQERRAKELMSANLQGDISAADLARECSLSAGHFARAFRHSTGLSPHQWLLRHRIEEAHGLLSDDRFTLAEIARACGFADQSHFTKAYTRLRGISPGAWRRQQEIAPKS